MPKILLFFVFLFHCCDAIATSDTTFEEFFRNHSSVILLIEPNSGRIIDANDAATAFYGYSNTQLLKLPIQEINMLTTEQVAKERTAAKQENRNYFIFRHKLANKTIKTVQVSSSPITIYQQKLLFSIIRDISSEREVQQQLWHYQDSLEEMVDKQVNVLKKQSAQQSLYQIIIIVFLVSFSVLLIYLLKRKSAVERQLRLASTVFHTATEAVMVCDINNNILAANKAFTEITGYLEEEVLGRTPAVLQSGHHDADFYQNMYNELANNGSWQGEISNRRKNGEIFYEWLSITALKNPDGKFEAYVALFSDITKRKKVEDKIYHQANFDGLTGLANRNLFSDRLQHSIAHANRHSQALALMFIDLDGFKQINDTFGHAQGDLLLENVSKRLTSVLRSSDMIARLGGDEFSVIISESKDIEAVDFIANKVIEEISQPFDLNEAKGFVTASIGIAIYPTDGRNVEELLTKADSAMYKAKAGGRNNYQFFTKEMDIDANEKRQLTAELRNAVHNQELIVWYQPIHHCQTHRFTYAEALIRWEHPERGMVSPQHFVAIAEEIGLINQLGQFVLEQACEQAAQWHTIMENPPSVAVNVSSIQFQQANFAEQVAQILSDTHLSPHKLILEITESLLIADEEQIYNQLHRLKTIGVGISLDDFGTGYSSLSYLKRFPINKLKIDRSFIKGVGQDRTDTELIRAIISMAKSLNMEVVAEGVETNFQLTQICHLNCDLVQGYLFSKPIPKDALIEYLKTYHHNKPQQ